MGAGGHGPELSLILINVYKGLMLKFFSESFLREIDPSASEATATWRFTNFVLYCIVFEVE